MCAAVWVTTPSQTAINSLGKDSLIFDLQLWINCSENRDLDLFLRVFKKIINFN